jgi:hypothetical protein
MSNSPLNPRPFRPRTGARLAVAAAVAVVGLTASVVWATVGLSDQTRRPAEMVTSTTPGSVTVQISRPGTHVVYLESAVPTAVRDLDPLLGLKSSDLTVAGPDGSVIEVSPYPLDLRYDAPRGGSGVLGQAIATFRADLPGDYVVSTAIRLADPNARMAVGDDLVPDVLRAVLLPLASAALSLALAVLLAVRALVRTDRQVRQTIPTGGMR